MWINLGNFRKKTSFLADFVREIHFCALAEKAIQDQFVRFSSRILPFLLTLFVNQSFISARPSSNVWGV